MAQKNNPKIPGKPQNNNILGLAEKVETTTKAGLFLPATTNQKKVFITTVLAVGPVVLDIKPGDRVLYKEYTQNDFKYDGIDYVIVEDSDVLLTLSES